MKIEYLRNFIFLIDTDAPICISYGIKWIRRRRTTILQSSIFNLQL
ncbi:hypothetical protein D1AOALGA4SA_806 [Olavius algarvensis Delta 1 endosymbiont]|nr:hypothetical protein D1AOALGA4SA_806 [Olavius algarvensis Delta 1 endosymbiont]